MPHTKALKKAKEKSQRRNRPRKCMPSSSKSAKHLLAEATVLLEHGDAARAATIAQQALDAALEGDDLRACAAYTLLGEIHVELGEVDAARACFAEAAGRDEDGTLPEELGGGPEKFNWLAQLSEEGGVDSVRWFYRAAACLRTQIQALSAHSKGPAEGLAELHIADRRRCLAETLCAVAEVYMTDLSWEDDAEARCEALATEATMLAPDLPDAWQTVANIRVSQGRRENAVAALERSMALWTDLEPEDPLAGVPAFASRVALARLLVECEMEPKAVEVCERLVLDDDGSVEAWYLGGLAHYIVAEKAKYDLVKTGNGADGKEGGKKEWLQAREWLSQCLLLFEAQEYEDKRLGDHAKDLLSTVDSELVDLPDEEEEEEDVWEDLDDAETGHEDHEMDES